MAVHSISQACDENAWINQRRASAPVTTSHHHTKTVNQTCSSGSHVHGCGCGCPGCCCRNGAVRTKSNKNPCNAEGGRNIPRPFIHVPNSELASSSLGSDNSSHMDTGSIDNSYEVQDPLNDRLVSDDIYRLNHKHLATAVIRNVATAFAQDNDDDDHNPWPSFVSSDHITDVSDAQGIVFDNIDGSSMDMEFDEPVSGAASMLSIYESSFRRQSLTTSQVIAGAGTSFSGNNFLPLTPESRGEKHRRLCEHCAHQV